MRWCTTACCSSPSPSIGETLATWLLVIDLQIWALIFFCAWKFSLMIGSSNWESGSDSMTNGFGVVVLFFLLFSVFLGIINVFRELMQLISHIEFKGLQGLYYYMNSPWNFLEIGSYLLLVIIIPSVHFWENPNSNVTLTWLIATESVILW